MSTLLFDLRCAVRALRKDAFGGVVILTLALGIGANTAMFGVAHAILLRPLPFTDSARLIALSESNLAQSTDRVLVSAPSFAAWKMQSRTVDRLAAFRPWGFVLTGVGEPERLLGARASADLFPLLGIQPIVGRTFTQEEDTFGKHHVALVSEGLWRRRFGAGADVLGRSLTLNGERYAVAGVLRHESTLIIGVVANVRSASLETPSGFQLYVPSAQNPWPTMNLVARTPGEATAWAGAIRGELLGLDPDQPVFNIRSLDHVIARALALRRFQMLVLVVFAGVGLALATIGVYSVVAYTVRLRTREIGLRLALGAQRRDVLMLVIRGGAAWAVAGILAGGAVAAGAGGLLRGLLFGIAPTDPVTFVVVISFAAIVVLAGSGIAGRRASRVDPLIALRQE